MAGGSGKTPFTIFLAQTLSEAGYLVAVSHRGYKGKYEKTNFLLSDRERIRDRSAEVGDEALLIAHKLPGIPVIVGKNRKKSLQILKEKFSDLDYVILDDSFQHLKIKKDCEFVLFNTWTNIGNGFVLPAGILREGLRSLRYANCIIYNGQDEIPLQLRKRVQIIIRIRYEISSLTSPDGKTIVPESILDKKLALLSGIGQPESFEHTIKSIGLQFQKHYKFPDHHDYKDSKSLARMIREIKSSFDYVLITEKDFTKLEKYQDNIPFIIVAIKIYTDEKQQILKIIKESER